MIFLRALARIACWSIGGKLPDFSQRRRLDLGHIGRIFA
jgi:hypothetical protein